MKKCVIFAVIICFLFLSDSYAQGFIKSIPVKIDSASIVRTYSCDTWVVCSMHDEQCSFSLVTDTGMTVAVLPLPPLVEGYCVVNDFEILGDSVFFCGYIKGRMPPLTNAVFGYFNINAFFSMSAIEYFRIPPVMTLTKMDLYVDNGRPHVVMIGALNLSFHVVVDARVISSTLWDFDIADYRYQYGLEDFLFDDVAVANDYVYVSFRNYDDSTASVLIFTKPMTYSSILNGAYEINSLGFYADSPVLIEHCNANVFSVLTSLDTNNIVVGFYNEIYCISVWKAVKSSFQCRDIKVNSSNPNEVDVLLKIKNKEVSWSEIITSVPMQTGGGKPIVVNVHKYDSHDIYSLDYICCQDRLIASGQLDGNRTLYLYRCDRHRWDCEELSFSIFSKEYYYPGWWPHEVIKIFAQIESVQKESSLATVRATNICQPDVK